MAGLQEGSFEFVEDWFQKIKHSIRGKYDDKFHHGYAPSTGSPIHTLYKRPFQELNATKYQYIVFEDDLYASNRYLEILHDHTPKASISGVLYCMLDPSRCELGHQVTTLRTDLARLTFHAPAVVDVAICQLCHDMTKERDRILSELREKPCEI